MGRIVHMPVKKDEIDIIQVSKNRVMINGVECESMDLEEFIMGMNISPEAEERFFIGLLEIIKEACFSDFRIMRIFKDVFKIKK